MHLVWMCCGVQASRYPLPKTLAPRFGCVPYEAAKATVTLDRLF